jgi:hypothetical protein
VTPREPPATAHREKTPVRKPCAEGEGNIDGGEAGAQQKNRPLRRGGGKTFDKELKGPLRPGVGDVPRADRERVSPYGQWRGRRVTEGENNRVGEGVTLSGSIAEGEPPGALLRHEVHHLRHLDTTAEGTSVLVAWLHLCVKRLSEVPAVLGSWKEPPGS